MLKTLLSIPSSTSQKNYPLFLFYSHLSIILILFPYTYYSYFILFVLAIVLCIDI